MFDDTVAYHRLLLAKNVFHQQRQRKLKVGSWGLVAESLMQPIQHYVMVFGISPIALMVRAYR